MKASAIEFKFRMPIMVAIIVLGFWSPWLELPGTTIAGWDTRRPLLEWLSLELSRIGLLNFTASAPAVIVIGTFFAAVGAIFRIWGAAYLSYDTIHDTGMQAGSVMADGPYRYVRNPLYIGGWCMMMAISFLMPASGALVAMTLLTVFMLRLILAEEAFLSAKLGEPYRKYLRTVPRLVPRFRAALPPAGDKPHWLVAIIAEVNPIGIFVTFAVLAWRYDHLLMIKSVLISFGISLVVRALMPREHANPDPA